MFGKTQFLRKLENTWQRLYRMAYSWCHDSHLAQDIVQETLSKALKKRRQLKQPEAFDAWIFRILTNCWHDACRRNKNLTDMTEAGELTYPITPEMDHDKLEVVKRVHNALSKLSIDQRQIVTLVDLEGMSYNDVAYALDIPIGTVMSRLCRARNNLKKLLDEGSANDPNQKNIWRVK